MFGVSFVTVVVCFFYISASLQGGDWRYLLLSFSLAAPLMIDVFYVCNVCYKTVETAKLSGELIHKIVTDDRDLTDEIEMFSLQVANGDIEFSAAQFFPIDHTLLFSIIGGVTTYIIILIQLSASFMFED
ncbi:gustatory receptor for bitter taste 66a-like [Tribolium castaneum]|uniref:Gustatory receptor 28a-like Protein n=1 Tax=Tribolium castaneum TaxID=7070 RepID=A0A139WM30_TRICA|nr:Putative gustatory receptor 28a-like Protein [Tribolium castaneum]